MSEQQSPPGRRRPISLEGKISILLGLVGLGGVGALQVLPHPYNDYFGWTLIWVAIIGTVALGVYHISTTVETPRYVPKVKPRAMTPADVGFLTALGSAAFSLIALGLRHRSAAAILAFVACIAVGFDFADRQWFSTPAILQRSLAEDNSRMEVVSWTFAWNSQNANQYVANMLTANNGKHDAIGVRSGQLMVLTPTPLADDALNVYFILLKAQLTLNKSVSQGHIHPGPASLGNIWFSALSDPQLSDQQKSDINSGKLIPYALSLMQYKDDYISSNEFIYTELCAFHLPDGATHNCDRGNNVVYISN